MSEKSLCLFATKGETLAPQPFRSSYQYCTFTLAPCQNQLACPVPWLDFLPTKGLPSCALSLRYVGISLIRYGA